VEAVDVSAPMLERAKERAAGRENITFRLADAASYPWEATHDAVISRFGVMFFRDPVMAFANLRRAMRPGGRLVFVCWRPVAENAWARIPYEVATRFVKPGPPPGPEEPGPFSFALRERVARILAANGFVDASIDPFDADAVLSSTGIDDAVTFCLEGGPAGRLLRDAPEGLKAKVREALREELLPLVQDRDVVTFGGATWIVRATTPIESP
jgi:SAM-dependent methyltransferase